MLSKVIPRRGPISGQLSSPSEAASADEGTSTSTLSQFQRTRSTHTFTPMSITSSESRYGCGICEACNDQFGKDFVK